MSRQSAFVLALSLLSLGSIAGACPDVAEEVRRRDAFDRARLAHSRQQLIAHLEAYAEAGRFPWGPGGQALDPKDPHRETGHPRVHRFRGPNGILCALAHLIHGSGGEALVARIIKDKNHFCVGLDHDPEVSAWISTSGLTLEECKAIQVPNSRNLDLDSEVRAELEARARLQAALTAVVARLKKDTEKSLDIALSRLRIARA